MNKNFWCIILVLIIAMLLVAGCDNTDLNNSEQDNNNALISSCDVSYMSKIGISTLNWQEEAKICNIMVDSIDRKPPVSLLRSLFKLVSVVKIYNFQNEINKNVGNTAYQAMGIIESRGQEGDNKTIKKTFEAINKIYFGSKGHVTLADLNVQLRDAGEIARTLSDEGLMDFGVMIWEYKKAKGE